MRTSKEAQNLSTLFRSVDNRTASFRVVGSGSSLRIECRLPGADCNPYLAFSAVLASGFDGIRNKIEAPLPIQGNAYIDASAQHLPWSLGDAVEIFEGSAFAKSMLGEIVHDHYCHFYKTEDRAFAQAVTDWERSRYFEQI